MLAAEYDTLPAPMRDEILSFFEQSETWLAHVLEEGQREGVVTLSGSPVEAAQTIVSGLEGALLIARPYGDVARFDAAVSRLLTSLVS